MRPSYASGEFVDFASDKAHWYTQGPERCTRPRFLSRPSVRSTYVATQF